VLIDKLMKLGELSTIVINCKIMIYWVNYFLEGVFGNIIVYITWQGIDF
jgi:hypothetical protein